MLAIYCFTLMAIPCSVSTSAQEKDTDIRFSLLEDKLHGLHVYFDAEIRSLRRTLRTEVAIRRSLEAMCGAAIKENYQSEEKVKNVDEIQTHEGQQPRSRCMFQFQNMSYRIDALDNRMESVSACLNRKSKNISTCSTMGEFEKEINKQTKISSELKDGLSSLEIEVSKLRSLHQNESDNDTDHSACLEQNVYRGVRSNRLFLTKPFFVSEWFLMKSQDDELSEVFITHGLGQHPLKVDVQVRPASGPNIDWIFPGTGSPQGDDDRNIPYGGVVYIYNETTVKLMVPRKNNDKGGGIVLYTGERDSQWLGDHHQSASSAYVRVRVWGPQNFPTPDFRTEWMPINILDSSTSFRSIPHHLGLEPSLVVMQVLIGNTNWISEGIGSTMTPSKFTNSGGIIHAFDKNTIRVWIPYYAGTREGEARVYAIFDGWGRTNQFPNDILTYGKIRVMVWGNSLDVQRQEFIDIQTPLRSKNISANLESDLLWISVKAADGVNKDFKFQVYGSAQNVLTPFGGLVCAYKPNGDIRTWRPNPAKDGFIVNVRKPFGKGAMVQASNHASLLVNWIKPTC